VCVCRGSIFENEEWQRRVLFSFGALSLYFDVDRSYFHHYGPNDDPTDPKMVVLLIVIDDISLPPPTSVSLFHYFIISLFQIVCYPRPIEYSGSDGAFILFSLFRIITVFLRKQKNNNNNNNNNDLIISVGLLHLQPLLHLL